MLPLKVKCHAGSRSGRSVRYRGEGWPPESVGVVVRVETRHSRLEGDG